MSYKYKYESYSDYYALSEPAKRQISPVAVLVIIFVIAIIIKLCERLVQTMDEREDREENFQFTPSHPVPSAPTVTTITENLNTQTDSRLSQNRSNRTAIPQTTVVLPLPYLPNDVRQPRRLDSVPQYEDPPNYEQALTLLNISEEKN